ncbi:MAG: cyclic nucleotide-binding domain-containing protein [Sphaerospermopsis sp. SIO1G1]|nr:cyclic nucleotide-binding domain-containing protein [Sphaerospermopsis sp. SIO1G1]
MKLKPFQFGVLQEQDIQWMLSQGKQHKLAVGDVLIAEGTYINHIHFILQGSLSVLLSQRSETSQNNFDQEISIIQPIEILGEISFLDQLPTSATVKAVENTLILSLSNQQLLSKLNHDLDFASRFYHSLCILLSERLRTVNSLFIKHQILSSPPLRKVLFIFAVLDDLDIDWILNTGKVVKYPPGEVLIQQQEVVDSFYILLQGKLVVSIESIDNQENCNQELAQLSQGEILGEMSFVNTGIASATVKTATESSLLSISQHKLRVKLKQDTSFAKRFYQAITVVITDRLRARMVSIGFSQTAYLNNQFSLESIDEDELDLDTLDNTALAATRFDWLLKQVNIGY